MGQQDTLIEYFYPCWQLWERSLVSLLSRFKRETQEDTPKAIKAAINEERCLEIF